MLVMDNVKPAPKDDIEKADRWFNYALSRFLTTPLLPKNKITVTYIPSGSLYEQAEYYLAQRRANFANSPKDCRHPMVYCKSGEDMHCQVCDEFIYRECDD